MEKGSESIITEAQRFAYLCTSLDLEVGKADGKTHQFGAVRISPDHDSPKVLLIDKGPLPPALEQLDRFAVGSDLNLGHNVIVFDLPLLASAKSDLAFLRRPALERVMNSLLNPKALRS